MRPTPRSEPIAAERIPSFSEASTIFIKSLIQSAQNFLCMKFQGAVITVPATFTDVQSTALEKAATDAGVNLDDRTKLIVDLGSSSSSLSVSLLSIREGLTYVFASSHFNNTGGDQIDDKFFKFFAADSDFIQKKLPLAVCPSTDISDKRAEAKLRTHQKNGWRFSGSSYLFR